MWRYIGMLMVFILTSALGWVYVYKNVNEKFMLQIIKSVTTNLRDTYADLVWRKYAFMLEMSDYDLERWKASQQFIKFSAESRAFFKSSKVMQATIFTKNNEVIFSLNDYEEHEHEVHYYDFNKDGFAVLQDEKDSVVVVLPICDYDHTQNKEIDATIEITYDIRDVLIEIKRSWFMFIIFFFSSVGAVSAWFYYKLYKNAQILNRQYEINLKLASAKKMAEDYSLQKSQFLANVSHELRTPLNSIIGFSELIKNASAGEINNIYKDYANDINVAGNHLLSFINDILDYSKSEASKLIVNFEWFDLCKVIDLCVRIMFTKAEEAGIKINQNFFQSKIFLKADLRRMKQVILNLLSNAVKFSKKDGIIDVSVKAEGNKLAIQIKDNGIGIAEENLAKVVSLFGQVDSKFSKEYAGTGLGLPLSKRLVELMNGTFNIESKLDYGTTVTLHFDYSIPKENEL